MKYLDYRENKKHGTHDFPIAYYYVDDTHPRYHMTYHWHPEYEIIRILQGSFHMTIDGQPLTAGIDDILFLQGGTLHGGIPEGCIYECIVFDMRMLISNNLICSKQIQRLMHHDSTITIHLPKVSDLFINTVSILFTSMAEMKPGYEFVAQGSLYHMLGIIHETKAFRNYDVKTSSSLHINRLKDVLKYIEKHYTESISLEDMAKIAGLSPKYFCRIFRKMTQYTPTEYLNHYRIECACEQLTEFSISIAEVAINCGFNDISYFIKAFHKAKGITPRQYKEANRIRSI